MTTANCLIPHELMSYKKELFLLAEVPDYQRCAKTNSFILHISTDYILAYRFRFLTVT